MSDAKINMIKQQIRSWNVTDEKILHLFERIDRLHFVSKEHEDLAYADMALPLPHDQEMLSPKVQAKILAALKVQAHETVLEIGTGNGFLTALLAACSRQVISVEFHKDISAMAEKNLKNQGVLNAELLVGNGANGFKLEAPVDVVVITGALPFLPETFKTCINKTGRILAILGTGSDMQVTLLHRDDRHYTVESLFETVTTTLLRAPEVERFVF